MGFGSTTRYETEGPITHLSLEVKSVLQLKRNLPRIYKVRSRRKLLLLSSK